MSGGQNMVLQRSLLVIGLLFCQLTALGQCDPDPGFVGASYLTGGVQAGALNQPDPVVLSFNSTASGGDPQDSEFFSLDTGFANNSQAIASASLRTGAIGFFVTTSPTATNSYAGAGGNFSDYVCFNFPNGETSADIQIVMDTAGLIDCFNGDLSCVAGGSFWNSTINFNGATVSRGIRDLALPFDQIVLDTTVNAGQVYGLTVSTGVGGSFGGTIDFRDSLITRFVLPEGVTFESNSGVLMTETITPMPAPITTLRNPFPSSGQGYGIDVAIDGDTSVVGANGYVTVFVNTGGYWTEQQVIEGELSYGLTVAVDNDTIAVGAESQCEGVGAFMNCGFVYVYARQGDTWVEQQVLVASDADSAGLGDAFGTSLSLDGDTLVVGARLEESPSLMQNVGAVYVFTRTDGVWTEQQKLVATTPSENAQFGRDVSLDQDSLAITSRTDENGESTGSIYVFARVADVWSQQANLVASDAPLTQGAGISSVVLRAGSLFYGNTNNVSPDMLGGTVYSFTGSGSNWIESSKITASDGQNGNQFGRSIGFDGDTLIIGTPVGGDDVSVSTGAFYLFNLVNGSWSEVQKFNAEDAENGDNYASSLALSGSDAVVGAWGVNPNGLAYTYALDAQLSDVDSDGVIDSLDNCTTVANADQRDTNGDGFGNQCDPDFDNNGVVNFLDIVAWTPSFGMNSSGDLDLDGDGTLNFVDFSILANYFQQPPGPSGAAP
ncbi:MAG: FG-GAP repeat protein [Pseudomonadota bacterium]